MPSARTHDDIAAFSSLAIAPLSYTLLLRAGETAAQAVGGALLLTAAHLVGSFWFSPDLDIDSAIDNRWGPLFWIWRPYMWLVPHRHRILSHSGFSALLRLLYLYAVVVAFLVIASLIAAQLGFAPKQSYFASLNDWLGLVLHDHRREAALIAAGMVLSDAIHSFADWLVTGGKDLLRAFGIRLRHSYRNHDRRR